MNSMAFTMIDARVLRCCEVINAPVCTALILTVLKNLSENLDAFKIVVTENGSMKLTTKFIESNLQYCVDGRTIRRIIRFLADQEIIHYTTDNNYLYIKINNSKLEEIKSIYKDENDILNRFIIYYAIVHFSLDVSAKASFIPVLFSLFTHEVQNGGFKAEMSSNYLHRKFNGIFTYRQEKYAVKTLVKLGILNEQAPVYKTNGGYARKRYFKLNKEKVQEVFDKYDEFLKTRQSSSETQLFKLNTHTSAYATRDGVKSDSYTKEEIEMFRKRAEETGDIF